MRDLLPLVEQGRESILARFRLLAGSSRLGAQMWDGMRRNVDTMAATLGRRLGRDPADLEVRVMAGAVVSSVYTGRVADVAGPALAALPADAAARATAAATDSVAGAAGMADALGPAGEALRAAAFDAFAAGMSLVLLLCAAVALLDAALVALFLPRREAAEPTQPPQRVPTPA